MNVKMFIIIILDPIILKVKFNIEKKHKKRLLYNQRSLF